jgi:hypothetical protein
MIALDPDARTRSTARHKGSAAFWHPQPGMPCECVATFLEAAVENENFQAVRRIEMKVYVRTPSFERNILATIMEQWQNLYARTAGISHEFHFVRIDAHVGAVGEVELPQFHEDGAARGRAGRM